MADWNHYFHFPSDTNFKVDGPFGYDGRGKVVENTGNRLVLRIDLDAWGPVPAFHALVTAEYWQEGSGNITVVEEDGKPPSRDDNATMRSNDARRERAIASNAATFSIRYENNNKVDFDIYVNARSFDFGFERS